MSLSPRQRVLQTIAEGPKGTIEIAVALSYCRKTVQTHTFALQSSGLIDREGGPGAWGKWFVLEKPGSLCEGCGVMTDGTGRYCPPCRQTFREDRIQYRAAVVLAKRHRLLGYQVQPSSLASKFELHLYDYVSDELGGIQTGLLTHLLAEEDLFDDDERRDWERRQLENTPRTKNYGHRLRRERRQ